MPDRHRATLDAALYAGSAVVALVALLSAVPVYRQWGALAVGPYAAGAVAAAAVARRRRAQVPRRCLAGALLVSVVVVPLAAEIAWGPHAAPVQHVESETLVTEAAATALVHGRDPYATAYLSGPLSAWPIGTKTHYPYLPLMLVFGLPRAASSSPAADARAAFLAVALASWWIASRSGRVDGDGRLLVLQALVVLPTGALLVAGGGDDVAVAGVMLVAVGLVAAERHGWAGAVAGTAAAMKQLAWPLLPFVLAAAHARRRGPRAAAAAVGVLAAVVVPFAVWHPSSFYDDVVRFPLGYGKPRTFHPTPAPGVLLARAFPHLRGPIGAVAALAIVGLLVWLLSRRGPWSSSRVATGAAAMIAAGALLAPASRLGFVVYPASLLAWAAAARRTSRAGATLDV